MNKPCPFISMRTWKEVAAVWLQEQDLWELLTETGRLWVGAGNRCMYKRGTQDRWFGVEVTKEHESLVCVFKDTDKPIVVRYADPLYPLELVKICEEVEEHYDQLSIG